MMEGLGGQLPGCDHGLGMELKVENPPCHGGSWQSAVELPGSRCLYDGGSRRATAWV